MGSFGVWYIFQIVYLRIAVHKSFEQALERVIIYYERIESRYGFKVIPQYCIAHPYCARFRVISARKLARARTDNERNFPQA